jgi:hypothetical protein
MPEDYVMGVDPEKSLNEIEGDGNTCAHRITPPRH